MAATPEVTLSPAIVAKAAALGNNPVAIHNWVRNTLQWQPTWGAIQSADSALSSLRGNAFDIASLEIALLRAAKIPARYQFGTIDLPAEQVQNWVGGVTKPEAALQLLNQGGIAAIGLTQAGVVQAIRMEHVWVQAYVNWSPSRGNRQGGNAAAPKINTADGIAQHVNPNGPLNTWVALDGSFKQYSYSAGMDLQTQVPLDANALLDAAQQGATTNAAEGWVQNLNQAAIQSELNAYQVRLQSYIDSTPSGATSTVGEVIGKQVIPQQTRSLLAGTLPYAVVLQGNQSNTIPSSLQHQLTYRMYASDYDRALDNPLLSYTAKTSQLVGKRLTISYVPASQADADLIASYLPKAHADGSPVQPSELPTSLPGYLIRLKAQINLDGQVVAAASQALTMGVDLSATGGFTTLADPTQWDLSSDGSNVVGQSTAIGISAGGISAAQLNSLKDRRNFAKAKFESQDVSGLSSEQVNGDILTAAIWGWFVESENESRLSQNQAGIVENPGLSYGLVHAVVNPQYSWGVVKKVTFPGLNMDIGHVRNLSWAKNNDNQSWIAYNRKRGQGMSNLEGLLPERILVDTTTCSSGNSDSTSESLPFCPKGVSAEKALSLAAQAGQKIFHITSQVYHDNPNIIITRLAAHSQTTKDTIQQALEFGYEVNIHEAPIIYNGWTGTGFSIIDPFTGAGGYFIEGGSRGAIFMITIIGIALSIALPIFLATGGFIGGFGVAIGLGSGIWNMVTFVEGLNKISTFDEFNDLAALTSLKAYSSIVLGALGKYFYDVTPTFGPINGLTAYTIFNSMLIFYTEKFK